MARHTNGWVKIHRKALLGDIGSNYIRSGLFGTLVAIANLKQSTVGWKGRPRKLERGELVTSLQELSSLGECERKTVLRHLNYLALRGTILIERSYSGLFVKINNYEKYQSQDAEGSQFDPNSVPIQSQFSPNSVPHNEELKNKRIKEDNNGDVSKESKPAKSPRETFEFSSGEKLLLFFNEPEIEAWTKLYSREFIDREFLKMTTWFISNPTKTKKTKRGWVQFVSGWLERGWGKSPGDKETQGPRGFFIPKADPALFKQGVT